MKGTDCSSELIGLYDVIARLMSLTLQCNMALPLQKVGDLFPEAKPIHAAGIWRHRARDNGREQTT